MYSRSYQAGEIPTIPESYSGVAFREPDPIPADIPRSVAKSADIKSADFMQKWTAQCAVQPF